MPRKALQVEAVEELDLEIPEDTYSAVCGALGNVRATIRHVAREGESLRIICEIPTAELRSVDGAFAQLVDTSPDRVCTKEWQPVVVTVDGVWEGRRVAWSTTFGTPEVLAQSC